MLQIVSFDENVRSLDVNDQIRKSNGSILIKVQFTKGDKVNSKVYRVDPDNFDPLKKKRLPRRGTKVYYISGNPVKFQGIVPVKERFIKT